MEQIEQLANRKFGDYILNDLLGRRAAMALYKATQESLRRFALVKVIDLKSIPVPKDALDEDFLDFTQRVITLEFMHLQPIYDFGIVDDEYIYIAARFMAGDLHELLKTGAMPFDRAMELNTQIVRAVAFVHAQGLIHSSLSPRNVYIDEAHNAYIDDLELSLIVQEARTLDDLKRLLDEPYYTSVEQLQLRPLDFRSEVYSIGAIMYHMLTGVPPFSDGVLDFEGVLQRKLRNQVIPVRKLMPEVPVEAEKAVMRCLRADPDERFPNLTSMGEAFKPDGGSLTNRVLELISKIRPPK